MSKKHIAIIIAFIISFLLLFNAVYAFSPSSEKIYKGIDVSEWQGEIDFESVKNTGIDVVYIRSSEGNNYVDSYFQDNYSKAKNAGLKVGFYHFLTARNTLEAEEQARFFASVIRGKEPDCKLAMDFEVFSNLGVDEINNIAFTFLKTVKSLTGKDMAIYSDAYNAAHIFTLELANEYPIWVADYSVEKPANNGKWNSWVGFQYTDRGRINGISGNIDKDYFTSGIFLNDTSSIQKPETSEPDPNTGTVIVERGDTLSQIAIRYNTSYQYLARINNIVNPNTIYVGEKLKVPNFDSPKIHDTSHEIYTVRKGDTLTAISKEYGVSIESIVELNNIANPNLIYIGETLRIPTINSV